MIEGEKSFDLTLRWPQRLRNSETELRLASERVEHARSDAEARRARWLRDLAQIRSDEGLTSVEDLPKPRIEHRSRNYPARCCPRWPR